MEETKVETGVMTDKKSLLTLLYSLRAGISLISGKRTKAKPYEEKIKQAKKEWKSQEELYKQKQTENYEKSYEAGAASNSVGSNLKIIGKLLNSMITTIVFIVLGLFFWEWIDGEIIIAGIDLQKIFSLFPAGVVGVLLVIVKSLLVIILLTDVIEFLKDVVSAIRAHRLKKTNSKLVSRYNDQAEQYSQRSLALKSKYQPIINSNAQKMQVYADEAKMLYKALEKTYGKFLDVRDWENVDLLIFYLETGRADSLKEALQLVDRQRQADAIVQAINQASAQICKTINARMEQLEVGIAKCFSFVSKQLDVIQKELECNREMQKLQLSAYNAQLESLHSLQGEVNRLRNNSELQRAQAEEWQKSSLQMMENANYMMKKEYGHF